MILYKDISLDRNIYHRGIKILFFLGQKKSPSKGIEYLHNNLLQKELSTIITLNLKVEDRKGMSIVRPKEDLRFLMSKRDRKVKLKKKA